VTIESAKGEPFATRGVFKGDRLTAQDLPPHLAQAVIAIEDRRFYQHWGVDFRGILRAGWRNSQAGGTREGGQHHHPAACPLGVSVSRTHIPPQNPGGAAGDMAGGPADKGGDSPSLPSTRRISGPAPTASTPLPSDISARGASETFAGRVGDARRPRTRARPQLAPTRNFGGAKERQETVLQAMVETQAISAAEAETARAQKVNLRTPPETPPGTNYFVRHGGRRSSPYPGLVVGRSDASHHAQSRAAAARGRRDRAALEQEGAKKKVSQAALVALGKDGAVLALVGGRDYETSQFQSRRPGQAAGRLAVSSCSSI